MISSYLPWCPS